MREIKLRAWDSEANIMVYSDHRTRKLYDVYYGFEMNENGSLECCWEDDFTEFHALDGGKLDNIMQFTGLHDKYGVEIYEGDITQSTWYDVGNNPYKKKGEITFVGAQYVIAYDSQFDVETGEITYDAHSLTYAEDVEVIGNIYENQELLEEIEE